LDKIHLLYVAENRPERSELTKGLEERGFAVSQVDSGRQAAEAFVPGVHQALICDLSTGDVDGLTLLGQIRKCCTLTPVVLLATKEDIGKAVEAVKHGGQHFVLKPLVVEEVEIAVNEAIEKVRLQAELERQQDALEDLVKERTKSLEYANRQLAALNDVSHRLNLYPDEDSLLEDVPRLLTGALDFDRATLWLVKNDDLELRALSFERDSEELIANFRRQIEDPDTPIPPHVQECITERKTVFVPDLNKDPRWPKPLGKVLRTRAMLMVPIVCQGRGIGLVIVNMQHHEREMDDQDITRVETFASMVGLALDNRRAYQSLEEKVQERTEKLRETNRKLEQKARQLEDSALELGRANVELLGAQEELEEKQLQREELLERLARGRDYLRAVLDSSTNLTLMVNSENRITIANRRAEDLLGIAVQSIINQPWDVFVGSIADRFEDPEAFVDLLTRKADSRKSPWLTSDSVAALYDDTVRTKGDVPRELLVGWVPVVHESDTVPDRVWIFFDVTALKQADKQLRAIIDASPVPLIVSRVDDGQILYANKHLARIVGFKTNDLIGQKSPDFYYEPSDRLEVLSRLKEDGYVENHEVRIKRKDGTVIWCLFSLVASVLADEPVIIGGLYDISERKEAEEKLQLYRRIFDSSQDGILVFNPDGELVTRNPAHHRLTGLTDEDVSGKRLMELVPEEARERIRRQMETRGTFRGEVSWPTKEDDNLHLDLSVFSIVGPDQKPVYAVGMGRDITERRKAQEAMQKALTELEKANQELRDTHSQLVQSEKMASLGMLVAGIAHEINTPVGAISSMHNTLIRAVDKLKKTLETCGIGPPEAERMGPILEVIDDANKVIESGSERVITIVRRLRSFARLDEAEMKEVDIHEGLEDTLTLIHHEIKGRIEVVREYGDLPPVTCYPGRLNQVFLNLLNNARQAILDHGTITIATEVKGDQVEIRFTDTGKGIAPDAVAKVFDPGFTTKGVGVGTGLGLSICYQIIEDHRGSITVTSELGAGTTFTVTLPINLDELVNDGK
jgi:PAS domain S-box-containing protein